MCFVKHLCTITEMYIHFVGRSISVEHMNSFHHACLEKMGNSGTTFPGNFCMYLEGNLGSLKERNRPTIEIVGNYGILALEGNLCCREI